MSELAPAWDWSTCAVVARQWRYLDPVRSLCRLEGIPVQMANEEFTGIWRLRETQALLRWLRGIGLPLVKIGDLTDWVGNQPSGPWTRLLAQAAEGVRTGDWKHGDAGEPLHRVAGRVGTRRPSPATRSSTTNRHRAKGLEFDHLVVLDGSWDRIGHEEDRDAPRRLYYVSMTRARQTLTLARFPRSNRLQNAVTNSASVVHREATVKLPSPAPELHLRHKRLSLRDVVLRLCGVQTPRKSGTSRHCKPHPWRSAAGAGKFKPLAAVG